MEKGWYFFYLHNLIYWGGFKFSKWCSNVKVYGCINLEIKVIRIKFDKGLVKT